jgi:hypothetical protein
LFYADKPVNIFHNLDSHSACILECVTYAFGVLYMAF